MTLKNKFSQLWNRPKTKKIILFITITILCLGLILVVISSHPKEDETKKRDIPLTIGMPVSVRTILPADYPARISALGEVKPRYQSTIKAQVSGKISALSHQLQVGRIVNKNDILVSIEKSGFNVQVAEAESRLQAARLTLLREEREARDAKKNWNRSGIKGNPSSRLVLREPHLEAARADLAAAESALENANVQLSHTEIKAPYDGVIMSRSVNPGESLFTGDEVAVIYSLQAMEVAINLDTEQWALLPGTIENNVAKLTDPAQESVWDAVVVRAGRHLDTNSRLRTLFLEVRNPLSKTPPLLPGTFVRADLNGKTISGLLSIPEAAQTREGLVWVVDSEDRLKPHRSETVFYGEGVVYIKNPLRTGQPIRVAVSPNSSYTNGLPVQPVEEEDNNK